MATGCGLLTGRGSRALAEKADRLDESTRAADGLWSLPRPCVGRAGWRSTGNSGKISLDGAESKFGAFLDGHYLHSAIGLQAFAERNFDKARRHFTPRKRHEQDGLVQLLYCGRDPAADATAELAQLDSGFRIAPRLDLRVEPLPACFRGQPQCPQAPADA